MAENKNTPGCPCCKCLLYKTGFETSTSLDAWTVTDSADGSIVSGELQLTDSGTTAVYDTAHPQSPYPPRVRARVKGGTGAELRLLLSWAGSDGFIIELRPDDGCGELDIIQRASGTETVISGSHGIPGAVVSEWHTITACYDPRTGVVTVRVAVEDGRVFVFSVVATGHTDGEYAGLATGGGHLGTAYFDDFRWDRLWYYGDGEQDDYDAYTVVIECSPCGISGRCEWIAASFSSSDDICEWTGATSDWTITGGNLGTDGTGADNSIILHRTAYPWDDREGTIDGNVLALSSGTDVPYTFDVDHENRILLSITFNAAAGSTLWGIVCATDDENYTAVEVTVGDATTDKCGTVKLISVVAGTSTDISPEHVVRELISGTNWILQINYMDGYLVAQIGQHIDDRQGIQIRAAASYGEYVGLAATGDDVSVSEFAAGCRVIIETCSLDSSQIEWNSTAWQTCIWDKLSGTWPTRTTADKLDLTADVEMLFSNPIPVPYYNSHKVQMSGAIRSTAPVDTVAAVIFGSDEAADDYYLAELKTKSPASSSTLTLYRVNSGTPTQLDQTTLTIPYPFTLTACISGGSVLALVGGGGSVEATGTAYGGYAGILGEISAGSAGDLLISSLTTTRIHAGLNNWDSLWVTNCPACQPPQPCTQCSTGYTSGSYQLTSVGIGAGYCAAAFCEAANQTVVAETSGCIASGQVDLDPRPTCALLSTKTLDYVGMSVQFSDSGGDLVIDGKVEINTTASIGSLIIRYRFQKTVAKPYDCENMTLVEVPLVGVDSYGISCGGASDCPCSPSPADDVADFPDVKMYVSSL